METAAASLLEDALHIHPAQSLDRERAGSG